MKFPIENSKNKFGPNECWCTQHGQVFYPCKNNKLCKETNNKFKKLKEKYINSKKSKKVFKKSKKLFRKSKRKISHLNKTKKYKSKKTFIPKK